MGDSAAMLLRRRYGIKPSPARVSSLKILVRRSDKQSAPSTVTRMHQPTVSDQRRPVPLRRVERYALLAHLAERPRSARLGWGKRRFPGHIRAWPSHGAISFRSAGGVSSSLGMPDEGTSVSLRFRVRGISFSYVGSVRHVHRERGRVLVKPDQVEWHVPFLEVEGVGKLRHQARVTFRRVGNKRYQAQVLRIGQESMRLLCWPCPKSKLCGQPLTARLHL